MGLRQFLAQGSMFFWPFISKMLSEQADQVAVICSLLYFEISSMPDYCLRATREVSLPRLSGKKKNDHDC